jgi:hypothetical protein
MLGSDPLASEAGERDRQPRAEVLDHGLLLMSAADQRLPCVEVLGAVEVAGRDRREPALRNPSEPVVAVEELEAVDGRGGPLGLGRPARGPARGLPDLLGRVRVWGDECGARGARLRECRVEAAGRADETPQAERERVRRAPGVGVVVGQLESRTDQEAWSSPRSVSVGMPPRSAPAR